MATDFDHTRYRNVCLRLWDDEKFARASDECKLVWTHLFTNRLSNPLGCYKASIAGLAEELNRNGRWPLKRYQAALNECIRLGFVEHDPNAMLIYFPKYFSVENTPNHPHSPNVVTRWGRFWQSLPTSPLKDKCRTSLESLIDMIAQRSEKGVAYKEAFDEAFFLKTLSEGTRLGISEGSGKGLSQYRRQKTEDRRQITEDRGRIRERAAALLKFLNEKASKHYEPFRINGVPTECLKFIIARLQDGASDELCRSVIVRQVKKWKGDPKMDMYLRPATIFNRTKFEQYAGEVPKQLTDDVKV